MKLRYYIDDDTGLPHIYGHGVSEEEVREVMARPGLVLRGRERSKFALGQARNGRYLKIVFKPDAEPDSVFIITAYGLTGTELAAYRRRKRRRR